MAFHSDGRTIASGNGDGAITLWDFQTGICFHTLRGERPYEHLNITKAKSLTEAQKATLRLLGAIEDDRLNSHLEWPSVRAD